MASVPLIASGQATISAGSTVYMPFGMSSVVPNATETTAYVDWRRAAVFTRLSIHVLTNGLTAATTFKVNYYAFGSFTNGNQTITVPAGATGIFYDSINSDASISGAIYCVQVVAGATGTNMVINSVGMVSSAVTFTSSRFVSTGQNSFSAGTTSYSGYGGVVSSETEANAQYKSQLAFNMMNLFVNVIANTCSGATVVNSRIGGADGTLNISIPAGTTGTFEDTTHTDAVAAVSLVNYRVTPASGTGSITLSVVAIDNSSGSDLSQYTSHYAGGKSVSAGVTTYFYPCGAISDTSSTEANFQIPILSPIVSSNLQINVLSNSLTVASTLTSRRNGNQGQQTVTIPAGSTGWFTDTTNTEALWTNDLFDYQLVTGGSTGSLSVGGIGSSIVCGGNTRLTLSGVG